MLAPATWKKSRKVASTCSDRKSPLPSNLGDISASGNDAFIFTFEPLVPADNDALSDVYDASVDGGLESQYPPARGVPCEGAEACGGPSTLPATGTSPGTSTFNGPGNPKGRTSPKCKKQDKKCKKKHHKKKHHKKSKHQKKKGKPKASRNHSKRGGSN